MAYIVADSATTAGKVLCITEEAIFASQDADIGLSEANISFAEPLVIKPSGALSCEVSDNDTNLDHSYAIDSQIKESHAFFYPPRNINYAQLDQSFSKKTNNGNDERPPLLVMIHGGPTARAQNHFDIQKQFWTTSGFAVLDVNHRGSTGFGREYRDALLGQWGIVDAEDIYNAIQSVIEQGLCSDKVFIRGKSAGGYAVQRALTLFPELFTAGASYYGIGDLATLATITHKFESKYCDQLLGEVFNPKAAKLPNSVYYKRSPIHDMKNISCPMILFQGLQDKVVPPALANQVVDVLKQQGVVHEYHQYETEGHGFRSLDAQIDSLTKERHFYRRFLWSD